ncbi:ArnT family glycosyltransferase [uncultured Christiangramia sp.]|nr:glycosyltransferase family 39 protein [uncultured Christiangramia sp.]
MVVEFPFLFQVFITVLFTSFLLQIAQGKFFYLESKRFQRSIFWFSLIIRLAALLVYYFVFYEITGTEFDIEAKDALWYHDVALRLHDRSFLELKNINFFSLDDSGYPIILSLKYFISGNSILFARFVQVIIGSFSVVLIYKISKSLFNESTGKITAIIMACFQPLALYSALHLKETYMIFFLLLSIYFGVRIVQEKRKSIGNILILVVSLASLFLFRTVLGLIAVFSLGIFFFYINKTNFIIKILLIVLSVGGMFLALNNFSSGKEILDKANGYLGLETDTNIALGGRSQELYEKRGHSLAKYATGVVLLPQMYVTPYPSIVKTNISFYNQTLQWYFAGGLMFWSFISYYGLVGFYKACRYNFRKSFFLILITTVYTLALISAFYIMSIRYNILKMVLLFPFVGYGLISGNDKKHHKYFLFYIVGMIFIIYMWNFIKLLGRDAL